MGINDNNEKLKHIDPHSPPDAPRGAISQDNREQVLITFQPFHQPLVLSKPVSGIRSDVQGVPLSVVE